MNKITLEEIMELDAIKKQINDLYEGLTKKTKELMARCGGEESIYYPITETPEGHKFVRIKLIDNVKRLQEGDKIFKSTSFSAVDIDIDFLKREPKEKVVVNE